MSGHDHHAPVVFDEAFWNERYRSAPRVWSGNPNPQLVAEVADLEPGRALDVGCGEGADAIWLARRGWEVVATDIARVALDRGAQHARDADPVAAARIEWRQADLLVHPPDPDAFDLVSAQFMQLPAEPRTRLFTALAASVRTGGALLVVGHDLSDLATGVPRPPMPERFYSADEVAGLLDDCWTIVVNEARPRLATTPEGVEVTIHDAVLRAHPGAITFATPTSPPEMATKTTTARTATEPELLAAAQRGDTAAFEQLVAIYRRPLHAHCYRMLGSLQDAEDALQETLVAAWRGLSGFEGRSSLRSWLYRIASNACLRLAERRPPRHLSSERSPVWSDVHNIGEYTDEPRFLEPYPSDASDPLGGDPAASYQQRENVELAFVAALQNLPPNQRAVLILREALQFSAAEVAEALDTTVASVNSALQRARKAVDHRIVEGSQGAELRALGANGQQDLVDAFVSAWARADVEGILDLLADDVRFAMPPFPAWFVGRTHVGQFLAERTFARSWRVRPMVANGQLTFACYVNKPEITPDRFELAVINVLTLRDGRIAEMNAFLEPEVHRWFGLPPELAAEE